MLQGLETFNKDIMERLWQDKTDQFGGRQKSKYS